MVIPSRVIDIHSHILPGIDDGARTFDDSIEIVKWLASQGVTDIIATPHYVDETEYTSPEAKNLKLVGELKKKLKAENIKVNVFLGNEIYINTRIKELIDASEIRPLAGGKYLLVEVPLDEEFPNFEDHFRDLMDDGYKIILAHPERYAIIQEDYNIAKELYEAGVLLQCNAASILGKYGKKAKKVAKKLAKDKMIFTLGGDVHHRGKSDYIALAWKKWARYYKDDGMKQLLMQNPSKILKDAA